MSAPAGLYNITADQGSTFSRTIVWKDPAKKPILMHGYTARMKVRQSNNNPTVVLELTTENGGIVLEETTGIITITASDEVMAGIQSDKYVYDLELVGPDANVYVYKLLYGNFVVRAEVTR